MITFCSKVSEAHRSIGLDQRFDIIQERDQRINTSFVDYFTINTSRVINKRKLTKFTYGYNTDAFLYELKKNREWAIPQIIEQRL